MEVHKPEKKVEYLELIYDLIFVFVIGRNNQLLHHTADGFISGEAFTEYLVCSLAVIQIWSFTAYYINIFGRNGIREHISLFLNMFLMYFMADGLGGSDSGRFVNYHAAWALILINIGMQYIIELRHSGGNKALRTQLLRMAFPLFGTAALAAAAIPVKLLTDTDISWTAIAFGIAVSFIAGRKAGESRIDFMHLTERAMLYVVFTFGEMIIGLAGYFEGGTEPESLYFAIMGFLIITALFLSYETLYDRIVDRSLENNGLTYIMIHVFLVFALGSITAALEFMRMDNISLIPKLAFLVGSLLLYYLCLFLLGMYAKKKCRFSGRFAAVMTGSALAFAGLMFLLRENMKANILLTVIYVFSVFAVLYRIGRDSSEE